MVCVVSGVSSTTELSLCSASSCSSLSVGLLDAPFLVRYKNELLCLADTVLSLNKRMPVYQIPHNALPYIELRQHDNAAFLAFEEEQRSVREVSLETLWMKYRQWQSQHTKSALSTFLEQQQPQLTYRVAILVPITQKNAQELEKMNLEAESSADTAKASSLYNNERDRVSTSTAANFNDKKNDPHLCDWAIEENFIEGRRQISKSASDESTSSSAVPAANTTSFRNYEQYVAFEEAKEESIPSSSDHIITNDITKIIFEDTFSALQEELNIAFENAFQWTRKMKPLHILLNLQMKRLHEKARIHPVTWSRLELKPRLLCGEYDACVYAIETFMVSMCSNFRLLDDEDEQTVSAASASSSSEDNKWKKKPKIEQKTFAILSERYRRCYRSMGLPWKLPDALIDMLGNRMQELSLPAEPASASDLKLHHHQSPMCDYFVEAFHRQTIQLYLDQCSYLTATQKSAVYGSFNPDGVFAIQGPPGTGKTELIACICILGVLSHTVNYTDKAFRNNVYVRRLLGKRKAQILVVCATNSAADHVAAQICRIKANMLESEKFMEVSEELQNDLPSSAPIPRVSDITILRKYADSFSAAEVPSSLWHFMTIGHAKAFHLLSNFAPQLVLFEEASMASLFDMFGVLCRTLSSDAREDAIECASMRRRGKRDDLPSGSDNRDQTSSGSDNRDQTFDDGLHLIDDDDDIEDDADQRDKKPPKQQKTSTILHLVSVGDVFQLDSKPFLMPKYTIAPKTLEQWVGDLSMNFRIFRRLAGSVHDCFMSNLPMRRKSFLKEVFRGHKGLYDFNIGTYYIQQVCNPVPFLPISALECVNERPSDHLLASLNVQFGKERIVVFNVRTPAVSALTARSSTEAFLARRIVNKLSSAGVGMENIAVITPYTAQFNELFKVFVLGENETSAADPLCPCVNNPELQIPLQQGAYDELTIGTVDTVQGKEFDYVIVTIGRNNTQTIGFLADSFHPTLRLWKNGRVNVMTSRQRKALIVLSDVTSFLSNPLLYTPAALGSEAIAEQQKIAAGRFMPYKMQSFLLLLKEARELGLVFDAQTLEL
uniref:DNA2/NAM7 helicase-like C-terminal domain-containing protein n=1 Tax=Globodera rostochiensis TaxID=31243 RepID=A0A914HQ94_GLORO